MINFFKIFKTPKNGGTGAIKDIKDDRDLIFKSNDTKSILSGDSDYFSLKPLIGDILNQKDTNSCTGHAGVYSMNIMISKTLGSKFNYKLNPWLIYYWARKFNGHELIDMGASMRDLMKALSKYGVWKCKMSSPYSSLPNIDYNKTFKINDYKRIVQDENTIENIKYALSVEQLPVLIGFKVYENDINPNNGIISGTNLTNFNGGHAVCLTGFKRIKDKLYFEFANSWGIFWGDNGFGYLADTYFIENNLITDIWVPTYKYF